MAFQTRLVVPCSGGSLYNGRLASRCDLLNWCEVWLEVGVGL